MFQFCQPCHHLAVAALPEEAAFCLLRDADAFEPPLVLLSGLSSETSYRVPPLLEGGFAARLQEAPIEKL